jgi:hypothetical protein
VKIWLIFQPLVVLTGALQKVMAKVAELKALKANYETEVGEPFDPPKEDSKKKDKAAAAATSKEDKGPSKNDLKKAAKAAAKDAKRADHKAAAAAGGESGSATTAPAAGAAAAPASGSKSAVTTPAAAAGGGASSAADLLAGAVLHCCASTGLVACAALSGAPADLRKKVTVNATAPAAQLARLVVAGGSAQVLILKLGAVVLVTRSCLQIIGLLLLLCPMSNDCHHNPQTGSLTCTVLLLDFYNYVRWWGTMRLLVSFWRHPARALRPLHWGPLRY